MGCPLLCGFTVVYSFWPCGFRHSNHTVQSLQNVEKATCGRRKGREKGRSKAFLIPSLLPCLSAFLGDSEPGYLAHITDRRLRFFIWGKICLHERAYMLLGLYYQAATLSKFDFFHFSYVMHLFRLDVNVYSEFPYTLMLF